MFYITFIFIGLHFVINFGVDLYLLFSKIR